MAKNQYGQTFNGNDDFRGYLAANAAQYLPYAGNNGSYNNAAIEQNNQALLKQGGQAGGVFTDAQGGGSRGGLINGNDITALYNAWAGARQAPQAQQYSVASGGGSSANAAGTEQARLQIEQGLKQYNDALGRTDRQESTAIGNIKNDSNQAYNRLLGSQASARQGYETNKNNQLTDYVNAREGVASNTRNLRCRWWICR
jgi:hypothetical protein